MPPLFRWLLLLRRITPLMLISLILLRHAADTLVAADAVDITMFHAAFSYIARCRCYAIDTDAAFSC